MLDRERELIRQEPEVAGAILCVALAISLGAAWWLQAQQYEPPSVPPRNPLHIADGPAEWRMSSDSDDILRVAGLRLAYWGNPRIKYSSAPRRTIHGIVVHCNYPCGGKSCRTPTAKRTMNLVRYLHNGDRKRGGRFGYHFYVSQEGQLVQGAPLSQATNHIKGPGHPQRRKSAPRIFSNSTTIGISIVGACDPSYSRDTERITVRARDTAIKTVKALQDRFKIDCKAIRGHGEMQRDRWSVEGVTIATLVRDGCQ
jgi:hypothetical protein